MQGSRLKISEKMCRNIYYMLCNAPDELQYMEVGQIHFEDVKGVDNLLAALVCNSIDIWDRHKMLREYKRITKKTDKVKGRINIVKSYTTGAIASGQLFCSYYKLNNDTYPNQIIKFALMSILKYGRNIDPKYLSKIVKKYNELSNIKLITLDEYVTLPKSYQDLPLYYRPILSASRIVIENVLANTHDDDGQLTELFKLEDDKRYQYIFEKFVRNFYISVFEPLGISIEKPVYRQYNTHGEVDDDTEISGWNNPDIVMRLGKVAAVIDTKWYTSPKELKGNKHEVSDYVSDCKIHHKDLKLIHGIVLYAKGINDNLRDDRAFNSREDFDTFKRDLYNRVINMDDDFETIKDNLIKIVTNVFGQEILKNGV